MNLFTKNALIYVHLSIKKRLAIAVLNLIQYFVFDWWHSLFLLNQQRGSVSFVTLTLTASHTYIHYAEKIYLLYLFKYDL